LNEDLLPIIKKIIANNIEDTDDNILNEEYMINTRIFSDCYAAYQTYDFKQLGFILKKVNHSICFS